MNELRRPGRALQQEMGKRRDAFDHAPGKTLRRSDNLTQFG
jgi:hypothetical protein